MIEEIVGIKINGVGVLFCFFFSSRRRHTRSSNVTGVRRVLFRSALEPEQVRVADITYLPLRNSSAYLSLVTDACSRKIMGYHVGENLQTENVVKAFRQVLKLRKTTSPLVHHSGRGCNTVQRSISQFMKEMK